MGTPIKRILLTGFEPFGSVPTNLSENVVRRLAECRFEGIELSTMILPVEFHSATELIREQVGHFDAIIMLGMARSRQVITVERVAINLMDSDSMDNCGYRPEEEPIVVNGPMAYFTNFSIKQLAAKINAQGIPCKVSNTAGTFVCNSVYYTALHEAAIRNIEIPMLFIHLPSDEFIPVDKMVDAVMSVLSCIYAGKSNN